MALTLRTNGSSGSNLIQASWWNDYYNLFTGAMVDQPITFVPSVAFKSNSADAPASFSLALATGTNLGIGLYYYSVSFMMADGSETGVGFTNAGTITTTTGNQAVSITNIPTGPAGTTARKIYRTDVGATILKEVAQINDNTTTSYTDTTADSSIFTIGNPHSTFGGSMNFRNAANVRTLTICNDGGVIGNLNLMGMYTWNPAAPTLGLQAGTNMGVGVYQYLITFESANGEGLAGTSASITTTSNNQQVALTNIPTGPAGTIARRVYRTVVGGSTFDLNHTILDNTTTTYTDSKADGSLSTSVHPPVHSTFGGALTIQDMNAAVNFQIANDGYALTAFKWGQPLGGSNQNVLTISPPDGAKVWDLIYNTSNQLAFWNNTDSINALVIDSSGNITIGANLHIGGGVLDWYSAGPSMQFWTQQSGSANGHEFITWNGSAVVVPFSIGGQFGSALSYVDNTGTFFGLLQTNRNGTKQGNTIFTGTTTPASPATGDIWIKA